MCLIIAGMLFSLEATRYSDTIAPRTNLPQRQGDADRSIVLRGVAHQDHSQEQDPSSNNLQPPSQNDQQESNWPRVVEPPQLIGHLGTTFMTFGLAIFLIVLLGAYLFDLPPMTLALLVAIGSSLTQGVGILSFFQLEKIYYHDLILGAKPIREYLDDEIPSHLVWAQIRLESLKNLLGLTGVDVKVVDQDYPSLRLGVETSKRKYYQQSYPGISTAYHNSNGNWEHEICISFPAAVTDSKWKLAFLLVHGFMAKELSSKLKDRLFSDKKKEGLVNRRTIGFLLRNATKIAQWQEPIDPLPESPMNLTENQRIIRFFKKFYVPFVKGHNEGVSNREFWVTLKSVLRQADRIDPLLGRGLREIFTSKNPDKRSIVERLNKEYFSKRNMKFDFFGDPRKKGNYDTYLEKILSTEYFYLENPKEGNPPLDVLTMDTVRFIFQISSLEAGGHYTDANRASTATNEFFDEGAKATLGCQKQFQKIKDDRRQGGVIYLRQRLLQKLQESRQQDRIKDYFRIKQILDLLVELYVLRDNEGVSSSEEYAWLLTESDKIHEAQHWIAEKLHLVSETTYTPRDELLTREAELSVGPIPLITLGEILKNGIVDPPDSQHDWAAREIVQKFIRTKLEERDVPEETLPIGLDRLYCINNPNFLVSDQDMAKVLEALKIIIPILMDLTPEEVQETVREIYFQQEGIDVLIGSFKEKYKLYKKLREERLRRPSDPVLDARAIEQAI